VIGEAMAAGPAPMRGAVAVPSIAGPWRYDHIATPTSLLSFSRGRCLWWRGRKRGPRTRGGRDSCGSKRRWSWYLRTYSNFPRRTRPAHVRPLWATPPPAFFRRHHHGRTLLSHTHLNRLSIHGDCVSDPR
jgi:hypothetical protein